MFPGQWLPLVLAAVLLVHVGVVLAVVWVRREPATPAPAAGADESDHRACPECGATNDPDYRYCRRCVTELPGATPPSPATGGRGQPF